MSVTERVSIVIPNWNGRNLLLACLSSLEKQTYSDHRVYVVDNGSVDGSVAAVREKFPRIDILSLQGNLGFATAMNAGFARAKGTYLVALNNDTTVAADWLEILVGTMEARPDIGFAASMLVCDDDPTVIDCVGDGYGWAGLSFKIADRQPLVGQYGEPFEILSACAAAAIYRRSVIEVVGGYDDDFFAYLEDVDLSLRARLAGFRCYAIPKAIVRHVGSASTGGDSSAFSIRMTARNMVFLLAKTVPAPLALMMVPVVALAQAALLTVCLTTSRYRGLRRNLPAYAQGLSAGLRGVPKMLRKRRAIRAVRRISLGDFARMLARSQAQRRARGTPPAWN